MMALADGRLRLLGTAARRRWLLLLLLLASAQVLDPRWTSRRLLRTGYWGGLVVKVERNPPAFAAFRRGWAVHQPKARVA